MPVPPALSCASDRASAPRLATVQKRREVGHCFNVRKVARCFCRRQKCAYEGGMAIHRFFSAEKPRDGAGARSACFPPSSKASAPVPVCFAAGILLVAELKNGRFFRLHLHGVGGQSRKFVLTGIYGGSFPDSFDSAQPRGGGGLLRRQRHLLLPCALCRRVFARCGITKRTVFPVGNGGGVQNSRQKAKSWSKVWANCRNRAQNY